VGTALLVEYFEQLPERAEGVDAKTWTAQMQAALEQFRKHVGDRYTEGTLQRLLNSSDPRSRRAAVLALGLLGTLASNEELAKRLRDDDGQVRELAADALWAVWFRADSETNNLELQRVLRMRDAEKKRAGLDTLIRKAPGFAEAYNQRAIVNFSQGEYEKSILDCERVLQLNPCHFGAQMGIARCYMGLRKPRAALKAFRKAYDLNPNMEGIEETIRELENALGEEGKPDDKK
jgi:tetratricopeptide (TPR) repeat protein